jgi:bleomycin hydrolase
MRIRILAVLLLIGLYIPSFSQGKGPRPLSGDDFKFKDVIDLPATSVKDQASTGTCWSFATTSMIESELLRMGKGEYDLSEMFIVRQNYKDKLHDNFEREGKGNTTEGSLAHDWFRIFKKYGIVPEEVYHGINYDSPRHDHGELQDVINSIKAVPLEQNRESKEYREIVDDVLDTYLGKLPESFTYKGKTYTAVSFAESLGINPDDYVEITSFTNFPFYTQDVLEVPDNWSKAKLYNVPVEELVAIMDNAFSKGYTVNWDGDVSERGFIHQQGIALMPMDGEGREEEVTQESRQNGFDNKSTTDDHLMHMTGVAKDQDGKKFYKTKNSWGTGRNKYDGYLYISENYVRSKTIFIMENKNAVPENIRAKLGI